MQGCIKELHVRWDEARAKWDDPMSRDFEARYLNLLEPRIRTVMTAMEKMEAVLAQVRRDCG